MTFQKEYKLMPIAACERINTLQFTLDEQTDKSKYTCTEVWQSRPDHWETPHLKGNVGEVLPGKYALWPKSNNCLNNRTGKWKLLSYPSVLTSWAAVWRWWPAVRVQWTECVWWVGWDRTFLALPVPGPGTLRVLVTRTVVPKKWATKNRRNTTPPEFQSNLTETSEEFMLLRDLQQFSQSSILQMLAESAA